MARKLISVVSKKQGVMVRDTERLCDAYIRLAYMDVSRHKTEKSESSEHDGVQKYKFKSVFFLWGFLFGFENWKIPFSFFKCLIFLVLYVLEAIPIPADQPIMQIKELSEVTIPTMEIKVLMYLENGEVVFGRKTEEVTPSDF